MQNQLFYNFLKDLIESKKISQSGISKTILKSKEFDMLLKANIIQFRTANNKGKFYDVVELEKLKEYFKNKFPNEITGVYTGSQNAKTFRDSKGGRKESQRIILLRGFNHIIANDLSIVLSEFTNNFNVFSIQLNQLKVDKLCFIENLDSFMKAEKTISKDFTYIHCYGRISINNFKNIQAQEILFCPDYDFVGLSEYLKMKSIYPNTKLYLPSDYDQLYKSYSKPLKKKNGREQRPTEQILKSTELCVKNICEQLMETKHFLEQQIIFQD